MSRSALSRRAGATSRASRLALPGVWLVVALALTACIYNPAADDTAEPADDTAEPDEQAAPSGDDPDDAGDRPGGDADSDRDSVGEDHEDADDSARDVEAAAEGDPLECMGRTATPRPGPMGQYTLEVDGPGEAWAWVREVEPFVAGEQFVVLFAITDGEGNPAFEAVHESGATLGQDDGPRERADSAWGVPAEEYAVVFIFDEPGCWVVSVSRGDTEGWLPVPVEPAE